MNANTATLRSNVVWQSDDAPLRACVSCDYGRDLATDAREVGRACRHVEVARPSRPFPTDSARRRGGACGPDAKFLTIRGVLIE